MRVNDFENAVVALNCSVVLDEVKIEKGHVRRFYGHNGCTLVMWDERGIGYSCCLHKVNETEINHDTHDGVTESSYVRDESYDLKF